MHARRERRSDITFYLQCRVCEHTTYHRLGGSALTAASDGGPVKTRCYGRCQSQTVHGVVRG